MPTYTFTRTLEQMRELILRKLQCLATGEAISGDDAAVVDEAMNLRLKELHALGVLWWNVSGATTDVTLVAGTASKSLSAVTDFLFPISMHLRVGTDDQEIEIISHREYQNLANKADTGEPEKVFVSGGTAYFWPAPEENYTVKLTYEAISADVEAATAPDIPVSMMRSFVTLVASDLVDDFGVPESLARRLNEQAKEAEKTLRTLNTERVSATTTEADYF